MSTVVGTVNLCDCCLVMLANGDRSGCDEYCTREDHPADLCAQLAMVAPGMTVVPGDDHDEFSRVPCDGCASLLAGGRTECPVLS